MLQSRFFGIRWNWYDYVLYLKGMKYKMKLLILAAR